MASHINLHTSLSRKTAANQKLGPLSETDICMSCGHPRSQHTADVCTVERSPYVIAVRSLGVGSKTLSVWDRR